MCNTKKHLWNTEKRIIHCISFLLNSIPGIPLDKMCFMWENIVPCRSICSACSTSIDTTSCLLDPSYDLVFKPPYHLRYSEKSSRLLYFRNNRMVASSPFDILMRYNKRHKKAHKLYQKSLQFVHRFLLHFVNKIGCFTHNDMVELSPLRLTPTHRDYTTYPHFYMHFISRNFASRFIVLLIFFCIYDIIIYD